MVEFIFETLDPSIHNRDDFDCGVQELNSFLQKQANQKQKRNTVVTHVAVIKSDITKLKKIYGYFSICTFAFNYDSLPTSETKKLSPKEKIPGLKLARLARNKKYTNSGFGEYLLFAMFQKALTLSKEVGIHLIDVDLLDENLSKFYRKYGFQEFIDDKKHMFIMIETIRKAYPVNPGINNKV